MQMGTTPSRRFFSPRCARLPRQRPATASSRCISEERSQAKALKTGESCDTAWYLDTGASNHMTGRRDIFSELDTGTYGTMKLGDGSEVQIERRGTILFQCRNGEHLTLSQVYYIPRLRSNIVSLGQRDEVVRHGFLSLRDPAGRLLARVQRNKGRLYVLHLSLARPACLMASGNDPAWLWHGRYGHLNFRSLRELERSDMATSIPLVELVHQVCDGCALGKQHRLPFPQATTYRADELLELVHTDLCGPVTPATAGGNRYFLLVVDDHSQYMWLEVIKTKAEAFARFKKIQARAEAESGRCLLAFRSDRGGEFNSIAFRQYCDDGGIKHCTTAPYTPQQNGVVERRNQTTVEMARCLLKSMGMGRGGAHGCVPPQLGSNA